MPNGSFDSSPFMSWLLLPGPRVIVTQGRSCVLSHGLCSGQEETEDTKLETLQPRCLDATPGTMVTDGLAEPVKFKRRA